MAFHVPEEYRVRTGTYKGHSLAVINSYGIAGNNGVFEIPVIKLNVGLCVIASDGFGWEHVSVSMPKQCPNWDHMTLVKKLFWDDTDLVVQYHPPETNYVNIHPYCLHLWRKAGTNDFCETPPEVLI